MWLSVEQNERHKAMMTATAKKMTKADLERRVRALEAENASLVSRFKIGRVMCGRKSFRGVPLEKEIEQVAIDHCRELLSEQFYGDVNPVEDSGVSLGNLIVLEDGIKHDSIIAGIDYYVAEYSWDRNNGTHLERLFMAVEVAD
jgi:hypothetical protein